MKKLIMWNVITLDGCFEGERPWDLAFHGLVWGKELVEFSREQLASAEAIVYGENTYKGMEDYWVKGEGATGESETAERLNSIRKIACSPTLERADWNNTTIVRDAVAELSKLKQEGEGSMLVFGSGILSRSLMEAGLFDEYRLVAAPVFLGNGRRLFEEGQGYHELKLLEARALSSGGVLLRYAPKAE